MHRIASLRSLWIACGAALLVVGSMPVHAQHVLRAGWHGGYGWRGGYWRGGWGYGPWVLGGLGLGLYVASLPPYYATYWWGGVPYYYADNTYYRWDGDMGRYESVRPPVGLSGGAPAPPGAAGALIAYPKNGQSAAQQGRDKFECHKWAAGQTGFDPTMPGGGSAPGAGATRGSDYRRAQAACLEGRGYSVK
jgi:hypothetical protein